MTDTTVSERVENAHEVLGRLWDSDSRCFVLPSEEVIHKICFSAKELLLQEENTVIIESDKLNVIGDLHGQFFDLVHIFKLTGDNYLDLKQDYVFMGDYVDRGSYSIELILLLFLLKILHPKQVTLLRGNHELKEINQVYGFFEECRNKYNAFIHSTFNEVFNFLPVAAIYGNGDKRMFFVHGGISQSLPTIESINAIKRHGEIDISNPLTDLFWSDPNDASDCSYPEFLPSSRGGGKLFNAAAADAFCKMNQIAIIVRSHQLAMDGYFFFFPTKSVLTVWSAPSYCYKDDNLATVLTINKSFTIKQFQQFTRQDETFNGITIGEPKE